MMKKKWSFCFFSLVLSSFLLYGCQGSGSTGGTNNFAYSTAAETAAAAYDFGVDGAYPQAMPSAAPAMSVNEDAFERESKIEAPVGGAEEGSLENGQMPQEENTALPIERKLIRNMNLEVETTSFEELIQSVQARVAGLQGYIEQSDISGNSITNQGRPSKKYASLTLRIPADNLNSFISQVESEGNVTYKSETVSDVTLQYSDIESRLKTLRMEQERLWELLAQANTTESIILLEQRLTEVSSEIESSESRLRYFDNSVTYSTVYLNISEVDIESPTQPETAWQQIQRGFTRNLIDLMDALTQFFIGLLSNIPVILFIVILAAAVIGIFKKIAGRRQKKKASAQTRTFPGKIWRDERLKNSENTSQEDSKDTENHNADQKKES